MTLTENGHPYIVRQSSNNGQKGLISADEIFLNEGNTISFGQDTATVFYQEKPYFTGDKIKILKPKDKRFSRFNAQFFLAAMRKAFSGFTWGTQSYSVDVIEEANLLLPISSDKNINFQFMEDFLRELERARLRELEAYLVATGLNNYELTAIDHSTLDNFKHLQWKEFRIGDLFERISTQKLPYKAKELSKQQTVDCPLPCLTSSFMNQGLNYYIPRKGATILSNVISIPSNSDVYRAYYQSRDFTVLSDAYAIQWKDESVKLTGKQYLFMVACINKVTDLPIYSYKNKLGGWNVVKDKYITLPTKDGVHPDLAAMEQLSATLQKIVIADVAKYTARNLEATQQVIEAQDEPEVEQTITPLITEPKESEKYISLLPVYSLRAACGYFGDGEEVEELGWMRVEGMGRLNKDMFVVQAVGQSMEPRIHNGDYCVFEKYSGGSRQGKIVLAQHRGYFDEDNAGAYSIKEYSSEKSYNDDGSWQHESITLRPFNPAYEPIRIDAEDAESFAIIGEFVGVVTL